MPPALNNAAEIRQLLQAASRAGLEGQAVVEMLVREDGRVEDAVIERASRDFEVDQPRTILRVAREMQFSPDLLNTVPVRVWINLPVSITRIARTG